MARITGLTAYFAVLFVGTSDWDAVDDEEDGDDDGDEAVAPNLRFVGDP